MSGDEHQGESSTRQKDFRLNHALLLATSSRTAKACQIAALLWLVTAPAFAALSPTQQWWVRWATAWNKQHPAKYQIVGISCQKHKPSGLGCEAILAQMNRSPNACHQSWALTDAGRILLASPVTCGKTAKGSA